MRFLGGLLFMYKTTFIICLCLPLWCGAQDRKIDFGLSAPLFFRPAEAHVDVFKHLFGAIGLDGVMRVNGAEETAMAFVVNAGIFDDIRKFSTSVDTKVKNNLYFVNINPSVVIPSKWPDLYFSLGIGTLVRLGQDVSFSSSASGQGGGNSLDSMDRFLNTNANPIIPYVSLGLQLDITDHMRLEFTLRPTLLNFYQPGATMNFTYNTGSSSGVSPIDVNYQPVYAGLRVFYFFRQ